MAVALLLFVPALGPAGSPAGPPAVPAAWTGTGPSAVDAAVLPRAASNVSFSFTVSPTAVMPKGQVTFAVVVNNTGGALGKAWVNVTLSRYLSWASDTASAAGATTGFPSYTFPSLPTGTRAFSIVATAKIGTPPGTVAANNATLAYVSGTTVTSLPRASASVTIGLATVPLHLVSLSTGVYNLTPTAPTGAPVSVTLLAGATTATFVLQSPLALPFTATNATASLYLTTTSGTQGNVTLSLTVLDSNGVSSSTVGAVTATNWVNGALPGYQRFKFTVAFSAPSPYRFAAGDTILLSVQATTANGGVSADLATSSGSADSQLDVRTSTYVNVTAVQLRDSKGPATKWSPFDALVIRANVSDPFGSADIVGADLNLTSPSGTAVVAWPTSLGLTATGGSWKLFSYSYGPLLANGTYAIEVDGVEANGLVDAAAASAPVQSPAFALADVASVAQAKSGSTFEYVLWYNNTGNGPAGKVWINDTVLSPISFVNSTPIYSGVSGSTYSWVLANVPVGPHYIWINVKVLGGASQNAWVPNNATLNFTDGKGYKWPAQNAQADVVLNGPVLTVALTSNPASALHANQTVVYSVSITNTGSGAATVSVKEVLPAPLAFVTSAPAPSGRSGNTLWFNFTNVPSGSTTPYTWGFSVTAVAGPVLVRGTSLVDSLALTSTSSSGVLMPTQSASLTLVAASPWISTGAIGFGSATVVPDENVTVYVNVTNGGNELAWTPRVTLTLGPGLTFAGAPGSENATAVNGTVALAPAPLPTGPDSLVAYVRVNATAVDRQSLGVGGTVDYRDGYGNPLPRFVLASGSATVSVPRVSLSVSPAKATLEAGTLFNYTITETNGGSGVASAVWVNLSLPSDFLYVSDSFGTAPAVAGAYYSWSWQGVGPGTRTYDLLLQASPSAPDESVADLVFHVEFTDSAGSPRPASNATAQATFQAPTILLSVSADRTTAALGDTFTYTLIARNAGSTTAHWVNLSDLLDSHLSLITFNSTVPVSTDGQWLNWSYVDLLPGSSVTITILVRVADGISSRTTIANVLQATYTNSEGVYLGYVRSNVWSLDVNPDLTALFLIFALGGGVGAVLVFIVARRYRVQIEDAFLIYKDGILISHLSRSLVQPKDEDVLSGMLMAVQDFVKDAFRYSEHRELHQLEFGDYRILIEQGKQVYLAVVYQGRDSGMIRRKIRSVMDSIENRYGKVLATWDGDMETVEGTRDLLREGLLRPRRFGPFGRPRGA